MRRWRTRKVVARPMWWRRMVESGEPLRVRIHKVESVTEKGVSVLIEDPTGRRPTLKRVFIERETEA